MSFYQTKQDLIDAGFLNQNGEEDELIGYTGEPCTHCGRMRVEEYKSGTKVCEKCNWNQDTNNYVDDLYYRN